MNPERSHYSAAFHDPIQPHAIPERSHYPEAFHDPIHSHANSERGDYSTDFQDPGLLRKINGLLFQDIELWMQSLRILVHFHANHPLNCHLIKIHSTTIHISVTCVELFLLVTTL